MDDLNFNVLFFFVRQCDRPSQESEDGVDKKTPVDLAYESDAETITKLMKSGLKFSRAFFPNGITDQFKHSALQQPKQR
jgi:hypothetical protein